MDKEFVYRVRGHWPFPLDMLRRDGSRAASPGDQERIERLSADKTEDQSYFEDVEIELVGGCKPNTARWESFGWTVPEDVEYACIKRAQEETRARSVLMASALAKLSSEEVEALRWHGLRTDSLH